MNIDPIKAAVAPYALAIKAGIALALVAAIWAHGYGTGRDRWQGRYDAEVTAHKATKTAHAAVLGRLADQARMAAIKARSASEGARQARETTDQRFKDAKNEADRAKRDLAAALRSGTGPVRLRDEWACAVQRPAQGDPAKPAGRQDAGADLRAAGAANLVAAGDAADRWIVWLQSELTSTRQACTP